MNLNELEIFQTNFLKAITKNEEAPLEIIPIRNLNQQNVIQIYQTDYNSRLIEALGDRYETIWAVIGDEDFFEVAKLYITIYPSDKTDLGSYGDHFPLFLKNNYPDKDFNFLKDIAEFEIIFWKVFHSAEEKQIIKEDLEYVLSKPLNFNSNTYLFNWDTPIYDLFRLRNKDINSFNINLEKNQYLLLYKNSTKVKIKELSKIEYEVIHSLKAGISIKATLEVIEIDQDKISALFQFLTAEKLIS